MCADVQNVSTNRLVADKDADTKGVGRCKILMKGATLHTNRKFSHTSCQCAFPFYLLVATPLNTHEIILTPFISAARS